MFSLKEINFFCWALFIATLVAPLGIEMKKRIQAGRSLQEDRDFVFFYAMGKMLNQYPPSQLYDYQLQQKVELDVHPLKGGAQYTPNPYPPFVGMLFRPFARLPFSSAYPLWLAISFSLYMTGLTL